MPNSTVVYSSESPIRHPLRLLFTIFLDVWGNRSLITTLMLRDLKAQYRQTLLGYLWLILPPLVTCAIWLLLNQQRMISVESVAIPYPAFVLIGTTIWTGVCSAVSSPSEIVHANREVLAKLNVCIEAFILAGFARVVVNFICTLIVVLPILIWFGLGVHLTWIVFPLAVLVALLLGLTIGVAVSPIAALYQDFRNVLPQFLAVAIFTAPVVLPIPSNDGALSTIMKLNPLTPILTLARESIWNGKLTGLVPSLLTLGVALFLTTSAFVVLRTAKPHIIARLGV